jgi:hypothetical protein
MELESSTKQCESHVVINFIYLTVSWVGRGRWNPVWICQHHLVRLNTTERPIVNQYREGKVKSTPNRRVKRPWNRVPTSGRSHSWWRRAFCLMILRVSVTSKAKCLRYGAVAKASLNRAIVSSTRRETEWSIHEQVEVPVTRDGGPNQLTLKSLWMTCG